MALTDFVIKLPSTYTVKKEECCYNSLIRDFNTIFQINKKRAEIRTKTISTGLQDRRFGRISTKRGLDSAFNPPEQKEYRSPNEKQVTMDSRISCERSLASREKERGSWRNVGVLVKKESHDASLRTHDH